MKPPKPEVVSSYLKCGYECPWCGSSMVDAYFSKDAGTIVNRECYCEACDAYWRDEYSLIAISWLDANNERIYSGGCFGPEQKRNVINLDYLPRIKNLRGAGQI